MGAIAQGLSPQTSKTYLSPQASGINAASIRSFSCCSYDYTFWFHG